jgi:voltage-gated potassium channel
MIFVRQGYVTIILVTLTIIFQSAGMAALIQWIKAQFPNGIHRLGLFRSFILVVRFSSLLVCLHMFEILLWASFYRWKCFSNWEAAFYFSAADYASVGAGDLFLKQTWRAMGPVESVTGVRHVRALRELPVCRCDPAHSTRGSRTNRPARWGSHLRKQGS